MGVSEQKMAGLAIENDDGFRGMLDERAKARFAGGKFGGAFGDAPLERGVELKNFFVRGFAFGNIGDGADMIEDQTGFWVANRNRVTETPPMVSIAANIFNFFVAKGALIVELFQEPRAIRGFGVKL